MRPILAAFTVVLFLAWGGPVSASLPPQTEEVIARYLAELKRVEGARGRTSMEQLFALTDTLQQFLFYGQLLADWNGSRKDLPTTMEDLSEDEYGDLCDRLRGILLNREEVVIAEPDSETFLPLAREKGLPPDRSFMDVYFKTVPNAWPSYIVRTTDYGGCGNYGSGKLVELYGAWRKYRSENPKSYVLPARRHFEEIQRRLEDVGGPCGGPESVMKELRLFVNQFPSEPITPKVREQLEALQAGRSEIQFR